MHDFETSVKLHYDELTEAEQEMTRYILNNRELVSQIGIVKLGTLLLSSKSSVLRLAKKLGFNPEEYQTNDSTYQFRSRDSEAILEFNGNSNSHQN